MGGAGVPVCQLTSFLSPSSCCLSCRKARSFSAFMAACSLFSEASSSSLSFSSVCLFLFSKLALSAFCRDSNSSLSLCREASCSALGRQGDGDGPGHSGLEGKGGWRWRGGGGSTGQAAHWHPHLILSSSASALDCTWARSWDSFWLCCSLMRVSSSSVALCSCSFRELQRRGRVAGRTTRSSFFYAVPGSLPPKAHNPPVKLPQP